MFSHAVATGRPPHITAVPRILFALVAQQQKAAEIQGIRSNGVFHGMVHSVAERLHGVAQQFHSVPQTRRSLLISTVNTVKPACPVPYPGPASDVLFRRNQRRPAMIR
jgi:hypothetical protein